jgi:tetratricopeptide (TPR) repeat protein
MSPKRRVRGIAATSQGLAKLELAKAELKLTYAQIAERAGVDESTVKNFFAQHSKERSTALQICKVLGLEITDVVDPDHWHSKVGSSKPLNYPSNLKEPGAAHFTGRDTELTDIHNLLQQGKQVAISGYGGLGKTELALQYARAHQPDYAGGQCWLNAAADAASDIGTQLLQFGLIDLRLTYPDVPDPATQLRYLWQNWPGQGDVLLILDDLADYGAVKAALPNLPRFKVLITTRFSLGSPVHRRVLGKLSPDAALKLLTDLVEDASRIEAEPEPAQELCRWLDYLPLGVELVGRYLHRDPLLKPQELLGLLQQQGLEDPSLSNASGEMTAKLGVKAAFNLSWQVLSPTAQYLAYLLSVGASDPMPWQLVEATYEAFRQAAQQEPVDLRAARGELLGLHLVQADAGALAMHRLIWEFFRGELQAQDEVIPEIEDKLAEALPIVFSMAILSAVSEISDTPTLLLVNEIYPIIPHLAFVADHYASSLPSDSLVDPFVRLGRFYHGQGLYQQAEPWFKKCLELAEQILGDDHPSIATSLNNLAYLYDSMGRYSEARELFIKSLEIREKYFGANHPETASILNNLGHLLYSIGNYSEAEPLFAKALEIRKQKLGIDHLHTALSLNNLAELYRAMGRYLEAEALCVKALEIYEQKLGDNHPYTAQSLNNMAMINYSMGYYSEAESFCIRALNIYEQQLGADHPNTAKSLNNLATLYCGMKLYLEAKPLYLRALQICVQHLGNDHPDTAICLYHLAGIYQAIGEYVSAEASYIEALTIWIKKFGLAHANSLMGLRSFLNFLQTVLTENRTAELSDSPLTQNFLTQLRSAEA